MQAEHLDLLISAESPAITPDGSAAVVVIARPDVAADRYDTSLWVVPTDGRPARRLTNGPSDGAPAVHPDGRHVAFVRRVEDRPQVHVVALDGGEPRALTDQPAGAGAPVWSPDGTKVAWAARVPELGRYGTEDADGNTVKPHEEPPRLVTEFSYRLDNLGYTRDRRTHLFVAEVGPLDAAPGSAGPSTVEPRQLTDGDADDSSPSWSPDGTRLAFVSSRHDTSEVDLRTAVYVVAVDADGPVTDPEPATAGDLAVAGVHWLPDGRLALAATDLGPSGRGFIKPTQVMVSDEVLGPGSGPVPVRQLTDGVQFDLAGGAAAISVAGERLLALDQTRGRALVRSIDPTTGAIDEALGGDVVVRGISATADGSTVVVTAGAADRVGDVAVVRDGTIDWLTDTSARLAADGGLSAPHDVVARSADGYDVHGWMVLPNPAEHGDGPYPVLLNIHGGPIAQYDVAVFDEAQVYAGAGYAVVMCNPRGSAGYGVDHARAIVGGFGTVDADDVMTFLDHTLTDERLDADRVGVMGGSYGGYMTALLTTRTQRFVAAIVERGYLDGGSFVGSSDIGWFFPEEYHGSVAAAIEQSPMSAVDSVATPTLVIHSEGDLRTPIEQGQRWFTELKLRGVDAELLVFPAESHELSRSGRPKHRVARFEHILRWWERHLPAG